MSNCSFWSLGMRKKQNFDSFFWRKFSFPLVFYFLLSLLPASFAFLSPLFFFCWAFTRLPFGGKRKYEWVVGQDFHWNFLVKVTRFFASFSGLFDWIVLIWVWLERSHLPAQVNCPSCLGLLKLMMSQVVQGTWLNKGSYRRFRGQCVNSCKLVLFYNLTLSAFKMSSKISKHFQTREKVHVTSSLLNPG